MYAMFFNKTNIQNIKRTSAIQHPPRKKVTSHPDKNRQKSLNRHFSEVMQMANKQTK